MASSIPPAYFTPGTFSSVHLMLRQTRSMAVVTEGRAPWELAEGRRLSELLEITASVTRGGCRWRRAHCGLDEEDRLIAAAWLVAEEIMVLRCHRARHIFRAWRAAATGVPVPDGSDAAWAEPFIVPSFGLPPDGGSIDHAEGYVAEVSWRMLVDEDETPGRELIYLARPDPDVTAPGADGFAVYRLPAQAQLAFRLWEIKKRDGAEDVSNSTAAAYAQLTRHAERYLAKLTAESEVDSDSDLADLLADLVPAWKRADTGAGAGVAVATDATGLPQRAFTTMHKHFPRLVAIDGLEGCLLGLGKLRDFTVDVRRLLWSGLSTTTP